MSKISKKTNSQANRFLELFKHKDNLIVMGIDPAGNHSERTGYGKSGFCTSQILNNEVKILSTHSINANKFPTKRDYYEEIIQLILDTNPDAVSCEAYLTRAHAVGFGDEGETQKLIELIEKLCSENGIEFFSLNASIASGRKAKFSDSVLLKKEIIEKMGNYYVITETGVSVNDHERRSIGHAVYPLKYWTGEFRDFGKRII